MNPSCLSPRVRLFATATARTANSTLRPVAYPLAHTRHLELSRSHRTSAASRSFHILHRRLKATSTADNGSEVPSKATDAELEARAFAARQEFGDVLPDGHLGAEETRMYERLYGPALKMREEGEDVAPVQGQTTLLTEGKDGVVEEYTVETVEQRVAQGGAEVLDEAQLDVESEMMDIMAGVTEEETAALEEYAAVVDRLQDGGTISSSDAAILSNERSAELWKQISELQAAVREAEDPEEQDEEDYMYHDSEALDENDAEADDYEPDIWPGDENRIRTHPLTAQGRFCTFPTTVTLPKNRLVEPITHILSSTNSKHLREAAYKTFNGPGIPESPSTPKRSLTMKMVPIPLNAGQGRMTDMQSQVYLAAVMPQVYVSVLSVMTETRKRLGKSWLRGIMEKEGGPTVLDLGGAGAGALAFREIVRAEWETMKEAEAIPGEGAHVREERKHRQPPLGKATVLTGSDTLRDKVSGLLDDTAFVPRLPDVVNGGKDGRTPKTFDVVIATHTLWPLDRAYLRKSHIDTYWNLVNPDGGVLILMEKGVPRGFEVIAAARDHLLKEYIANSGGPDVEDPQNTAKDTSTSGKETGMIIAPCTNHSKCPMYLTPGISHGRKTWCHFAQRYDRPSFLHRLIEAKGRNDDKVDFSYIATWRGKDLRQQSTPIQVEDDRVVGEYAPPQQGQAALQKALQGGEAELVLKRSDAEGVETTQYLATGEPFDAMSSTPVYTHPLDLPRAVMPPLKRKKMVIIDVCTPAATLDRWFVTKGYSRQAYRDARKSAWGDLWALGATSRQRMRVNFGKGKMKILDEARGDFQKQALRGEDSQRGTDGEEERRIGEVDDGFGVPFAEEAKKVERSARSEKRYRDKVKRAKRKAVKEQRKKIKLGLA